MLRNEFRYSDDKQHLYIIVTKKDGRVIQYKFDAIDVPILYALDRKMFAKHNDNLFVKVGGKDLKVSEYLTGHPQITHKDKDNTNLTRSNLQVFTFTNTFWLEDGTMFIQIGDQVTMVDEEVLWLVLSLHSLRITSGGYVMTTTDGRTQSFSRWLYEVLFGEVPSDLEIDHINGNTLDNRLENLRVLTRKENKTSIHSTSGIFPHVKKIGERYQVTFRLCPEYNSSFEKFEHACKYVHVVRNAKYGHLKGTATSFENLEKVLKGED